MVSTPPQLPPIQELAPLEINHEDDGSVMPHNFYKMRINAATHEESETCLESGAPLSEAEREFLKGVREYHAALRGETTPKSQSATSSIDNMEAEVKKGDGKMVKKPKSVTLKDAAHQESKERGVIDLNPGPDYVPPWFGEQLAALREKYKYEDATRNSYEVKVQDVPARQPSVPIFQTDEEELRQEVAAIIKSKTETVPEPITKEGGEGGEIPLGEAECADDVVKENGTTAQAQLSAADDEHLDAGIA